MVDTLRAGTNKKPTEAWLEPAIVDHLPPPISAEPVPKISFLWRIHESEELPGSLILKLTSARLCVGLRDGIGEVELQIIVRKF